ncbi:MAG: L,D-transpeptidase family protein [Thermoleophilaceae bacterium]
MDLRARVSYSRRAVANLVRRVERDVNRPPRDATVKPSGAGLNRVQRPDRPAAPHRGTRPNRLRSAIRRPEVRKVKVRADVTKPKVLTRELAKRYPHYITVDRGGHTLRYYRNLEMKSSHTIAVGQAGLDTPAGKYSIQNKAEDPAWHVPNSDWAGDKAGQIIPGGTAENPLKARWMGIFDGAGIHGTDQTGSLGTNASHGCIRMSIPEVIELYKRVPVKTPIYIG